MNALVAPIHGFRPSGSTKFGSSTGELRDPSGKRATELLGHVILYRRMDLDTPSSGIVVGRHVATSEPTGSNLVLHDPVMSLPRVGWINFADFENRLTSPVFERSDMISTLAEDTQWIESDVPTTPAPSGDALRDLRHRYGLTYADLAIAFGRNEPRTIQYWPNNGVPETARPVLDQLVAIGAYLVGGLGPSGTRAWFRAGSPSRLQRIAADEIASVLREARSYVETVAT